METAFKHDWFSRHAGVWTDVLAHLKGRHGLRALEIGSFEGCSACWLLTNILTDPTCSMTCVDVFTLCDEMWEVNDERDLGIAPGTDIEAAFDRNVDAIGRSSCVEKKKGASSEVLRTLPFSSYDVAYIDGSHRAASVLQDLVLAWDLLKENGIVILDDYDWQWFRDPQKTPKIAIDAFLSVYAGKYEMLHKDYQVILRKRPEKPYDRSVTEPT